MVMVLLEEDESCSPSVISSFPASLSAENGVLMANPPNRSFLLLSRCLAIRLNREFARDAGASLIDLMVDSGVNFSCTNTCRSTCGVQVLYR